jgi:MinD superfamily P-loop ATPase
MIISIASGKGGTGKTIVAVDLALSLNNVQILDCDVEEPNAHLFIHPEIREEKPVYIKVPKIDEERCDYCGECADFCEFNALFVVRTDVERGIKGSILTFPQLCHGCGGCSIVCQKNAIFKENREIGVIKKGITDDMDLVFGELNISEAMAVPVIKAVKGEIKDEKTVIIDSPPGTSCPVINSVYGSDFCILVTEPTPFGLYDLKLAVEVLREVKIPFGIIVNRAGIGDEGVYDYCEEEKIPILLEIPYDRQIAELYSKGTPFVSEMKEWKKKLSEVFDRIKSERDGNNKIV